MLPLLAAAGCGSQSTDYRPEPGDAAVEAADASLASEEAAASRSKGRLIFKAAIERRYVSGTWRAGSRRGDVQVVSRRPLSGDRAEVRLSVPRPTRGSVRVDLSTYLPYVDRRRLTLTETRSGVRVRSGAITPGLPDPARARGAQMVHVKAGAQGGDGSAERPTGDLNAAVRDAADGAVVLVAPGQYPMLEVRGQQREVPVTIRGAEAERPRIKGAVIEGSTGLRVDRVVLVAGVYLGDKGAPARRISITDSDLTTDKRATCLSLRHGSEDVSLRFNRFYDCMGGVAGQGPSEQSRRIEIRGNLMEDFNLDGIQFVNWSDVVVDRNVIRRMFDPQGENHADGVQAIGGGERVRITNNEISESRHQLILISADIGGPMRDVTVENNLLYDAGSFALNSFGTDGLRLVNNTVWRSLGGVILGSSRGFQPKDIVVANNLASSFFAQKLKAPIDGDTNASKRSNLPGERGRIDAKRLRFRDEAAGDFRLPPSSFARRAADPDKLPADDLYGIPRRSRSLGAID